MEQKSRILIVGCGGIGGIFASHLTTLDQAEITVVSRNKDIVDAVRKDGLQVSGHSGVTVTRVNIRDTIPPGHFDFVILATQPPQVEDATREVSPCLSPDGAVVVLQNGLCEARVAALVGPKRVLGGIVTFGASTSAPGKILRTSRGGVLLGSYTGDQDPRLETLRSLLTGLGQIAITENLHGARFSKLALNCAVSGLGTLAGVRLGTLLSNAEARNLALAVMREAVAVSQAEAIDLEPIGGTFDLQWLADPEATWAGPAHWKRHAMLLLVGFKYRNLRSSMLRAIERGRPPAVDFLNGEVVTMGTTHGIPTPINAALTQLIHRIADGHTSPSPQHLKGLRHASAEIE